MVDGRRSTVTEEVVAASRSARCCISARRGVDDQPKLLIVAPMSGHFSTLLRGTVAAALPDHDVYVTDWINARNVPLRYGRFGLDDFSS